MRSDFDEPSRPDSRELVGDLPEARDPAFASLVGPYFDSVFYVAKYPAVGAKITAGEFTSALDHYVLVGHREGLSPNGEFHETFYVRSNVDVARAVERGAVHCGFHHYLLWGRAEGRRCQAPTGIVCVIDSIEGNEVRGWAANLAEPNEHLDLNVLLSGIQVGRVRAELSRADLLSILPTATHGFTFRVPHAYCDGTPRSLTFEDAGERPLELRSGPTGKRADEFSFRFRHDDGVSVALRAEHALGILSEQVEALREALAFTTRLGSFPLSDYRYYYDRFLRYSPFELEALEHQATDLAYQPRFSIVLPVYDPDTGLLDRAIRSALSQAYPKLELCIADDASTDEGVRDVIRRHAARDARVRVVFGEENGGLTINTNRALDLATGDYVAFMDHDDLLAPDALYAMAQALQHRRFPVLYSDEDLIDQDDVPLVPHLKPDLDYDFVLAINYVCHLLVVERQLAMTLRFREGFDGCQDRDFVLRALETVSEGDVCHVPRVLYHWRVNPKSVSQTEKNRTSILERSVRSVQEHLDRTRQQATVAVGRPELFSCRVTWPVPAPAPKVSIIVPTKDRLDLLGPCLSSVLRVTRYQDFEVVIANHDSVEPGTRAYLDVVGRDPRTRVVDYSGPFNWAAMNNFVAERVHGTVLVFLNNDTLVTESDWLSELVGHAMRPDVGAVGARLLYEDGTVQHAGVVLGVSGFAGHAFQRTKADDPGYLGRSLSTTRVSAVTGACLACRKEVFDEVHGFDSGEFAVGLNDVDFCLRLAERGYKVLYDPHAVVYHLESKSRGYDADHEAGRTRLGREVDRLKARWDKVLMEDPWYNPAFDRHAPPYERLRVLDRAFTVPPHRRENIRRLVPLAETAPALKDRRPA